jgi:hypothetical protein
MVKFTKIYYINSNSNKFDYISTDEYEFNDYKFNTNNFNEKINEILEEKSNVLIYIEDIDEAYLQNIIKILDKHKNFELTNVTIFNKITDADLAIPLFFSKTNKLTFKKILNIFPFEIAIKVCSETTFNLVKIVNKSIDVIRNDNEPKDKCYAIWYQKGGAALESNQKRYIFRLMETNKVDDLEQTWWFKYYFSIPPCAYGRLSQSSGTCWCNVVLNICLLTPAISKLFIQKFNSLDSEKKKYIQEKYKECNDINNCNDTLLNIIYGIINIFLINKKKATTLDGNFISEIAARIKGIYLENDEFYYQKLDEKLQYGDYFYTIHSFYILISLILKKNIDYVFIETYGITELTTKYDQLKNIQNKTNSDIDIFNKIDDLFYFSYFLSKNKLQDPNENISMRWSDIVYNVDEIVNASPPLFIVLPIFGNITREIIYVNDIEYKLHSGIIDFKTNIDHHTVSGLFCNDKYYIYDSNNIISYSKWYQNVYNEYIELINDYYKVNGYSYDFILEFCIYVKN